MYDMLTPRNGARMSGTSYETDILTPHLSLDRL